MERTPDCYFVIAIVVCEEGDVEIVVYCVDYGAEPSSGSLVVVCGQQYLKHLGS